MRPGSNMWFRVRRVTAPATRVVVVLAHPFVPHPLLGRGRGVDHVGVGVRDPAQAERDFERLGFEIHPGGHVPGGVVNEII